MKMDAIYTCAYCKTDISWEGADDRNGNIWGCDKCGIDFCTKCFIDSEGSEAFQHMMNSMNDTLCPECFNAMR